MPDVKIFADGQVVDWEVRGLLFDRVPEIVAQELSCFVWGWRWPFVKYERLDPDNVDVMLFWDEDGSGLVFDLFSNTHIVIEVAAYAFLDRRRNIRQRIQRIAQRIKEVADPVNPSLNDDHATTITFIPVKRRHWARAARVYA